MEVEPDCGDFGVEPIQCDLRSRTEIYLLSLMTGMSRRTFNLEGCHEQGSRDEDVVDFPLFVRPSVFVIIFKYLFMKDCRVAADPVIVIDDKEKR
jgi:hypothetical protein